MDDRTGRDETEGFGEAAQPEGAGAALVEFPQKKARKTALRRVPQKLCVPGTLDHAFRQMGGREFAISIARFAGYQDQELREVARLYDEETLQADREAKPRLLEEMCLAAGISPSDFLGRICAAAHRHNFDVSRLVAAVESPRMLEAAARYGMEKDGFKDRKMVLEASGVIEKQSLVQVTQNNNQNSVSVNAPSQRTFEAVTREISDLLRGATEAKLLPPREEDSTAGVVVDAEIVEENA